MALNQGVKHAFLVDRAQKPMLLAIDGYDGFIEMPTVAELRRTSAEWVRKFAPKRTASHAFVADNNSAVSQQVLNILKLSRNRYCSQTASVMTSAGKR
jgi:hypothetical protein